MEDLIKCCELHNESLTSCLVVLSYCKNNGWTEAEAIPHIIKLVTDGWFKKLRELVK